MVTEKECKKCGKVLPSQNFNKQSDTVDGLRSWCRSCTSEYCRSWKKSKNYSIPDGKYSDSQKSYRQKNREYIRSKKNKPCNLCGVTLDPILMDFDHLHSKKKNLAAMSINRKELIDQEIAKCQVLCIFCHKEKTHLSIPPEKIPSTPKKYNRYIAKKWKQYFSIVARGKPCYVCNKSFPYYQMELDHQPQFTKLAHVSKLIFHMVDDLIILKEIGKCKPICCACHRIKSLSEESLPASKEKWQYYNKRKVANSGCKFCPQCHLEKKITDFSQNGWCKLCFSSYRKTKRRLKNKNM